MQRVVAKSLNAPDLVADVIASRQAAIMAAITRALSLLRMMCVPWIGRSTMVDADKFASLPIRMTLLECERWIASYMVRWYQATDESPEIGSLAPAPVFLPPCLYECQKQPLDYARRGR